MIQNNIKTMVRKSLTLVVAVSLLALTACEEKDPIDDPNNPNTEVSSSAKTKPNAPDTKLEVSMTGAINHTTHTPGDSGSVTFNRFPYSIDEFKSVQKQIGGEPHGAVALELMAAEMYRWNAAIGTECLKLCNIPINVNLQTNRWKELFGNDVNYNRPYQIGAYLRGATPENKYTPNEPYTIEVRVRKNRAYENSTDYQCKVLFLEVMTKGKETNGCDLVDVVKPEPCNSYPNGSNYFVVFNCPGLYAQVKQIYDPSWDKLK